MGTAKRTNLLDNSRVRFIVASIQAVDTFDFQVVSLSPLRMRESVLVFNHREPVVESNSYLISGTTLSVKDLKSVVQQGLNAEDFDYHAFLCTLE